MEFIAQAADKDAVANLFEMAMRHRHNLDVVCVCVCVRARVCVRGRRAVRMLVRVCLCRARGCYVSHTWCTPPPPTPPRRAS